MLAGWGPDGSGRRVEAFFRPREIRGNRVGDGNGIFRRAARRERRRWVVGPAIIVGSKSARPRLVLVSPFGVGGGCSAAVGPSWTIPAD